MNLLVVFLEYLILDELASFIAELVLGIIGMGFGLIGTVIWFFKFLLTGIIQNWIRIFSILKTVDETRTSMKKDIKQ